MSSSAGVGSNEGVGRAISPSSPNSYEVVGVKNVRVFDTSTHGSVRRAKVGGESLST